VEAGEVVEEMEEGREDIEVAETKKKFSVYFYKSPFKIKHSLNPR